MTEKEFLIKLAITQFNEQYGETLHIEDCDISSILPSTGFKLGYEINTLRLDDYITLHLYLNVTNRDVVFPFNLEVDNSSYVNSLGDELFVASGEVSQSYIDFNIYKFRWINSAYENLPIFLTEDGFPFLLESGGYMILENGA